MKKRNLIALILALSTGIQVYIDDVQEETLSSYPLAIKSQETDMAGLLSTLAGALLPPKVITPAFSSTMIASAEAITARRTVMMI